MTLCSQASAAAAEPLAGTAPEAVGWVALEQAGPWGAKAFTASHLDPETGRAIEAAAAAAAVRPVLVRRPARHPDVPGERTVLVAHSRPGRSWLLRGVVESPAAVAALDWEAVAAGDADAVRRSLPGLAPAPEPELLVCTNGRRDVCCALVGRPVAVAAGASRPERVWETTHTSGHRFAPTGVLLPAGTLHGRLDASAAIAVLDAAAQGRLVLEGYRGRSVWPAPGQAAEAAVRRRTGEDRLDALAVSADGVDQAAWVVSHEDGRRWRVPVVLAEADAARPESCGKAAVPMRTWSAGPVEPVR